MAQIKIQKVDVNLGQNKNTHCGNAIKKPLFIFKNFKKGYMKTNKVFRFW